MVYYVYSLELPRWGDSKENKQYSTLFYPITLEGRRGTTDEFATIPFHLVLFSAAVAELAKSIPVHSLILSSHLFFCRPLFLCSFTVSCRIVFAKPEDLERWSNHLSINNIPSCKRKSKRYPYFASWLTLISSSYPCLEHISMPWFQGCSGHWSSTVIKLFIYILWGQHWKRYKIILSRKIDVWRLWQSDCSCYKLYLHL